MTSLLLNRLKTDAFDCSIGFHHTPSAVRRRLLMSRDVRHLAAALRFGAITENMIRELVSSIMSEFSRGRRLPNDLALAAIAVVLELAPTDFAEEYLHDLARLKLAEMRHKHRRGPRMLEKQILCSKAPSQVVRISFR